MKPSYRPRNKRRIAKHGFRARMADRWGRAVLSRRRKKGRKRDLRRYLVPQRDPQSVAEAVWKTLPQPSTTARKTSFASELCIAWRSLSL